MIRPDSDLGEHLARARFFLEQAKAQKDPQKASWFVMASVYSARAVIELMVDYFKTKKLKEEFKDFLSAAAESVLYFKIIEYLRDHDFHRRAVRFIPGAEVLYGPIRLGTGNSPRAIAAVTGSEWRGKWKNRFEAQAGEIFRGFSRPETPEISVKEIKNWLKKRGAAVTNNNYRTALSVLFSHAKTEEWIASNPIEYVAAEEEDTKQPGILELFQVRALIKACVEFQPDFVPAVTIALFGGIRPESELWHLERQHVDLKKAEIDVHKSKSRGSTRFLKIQQNLVAWLQRYLKDEPGPISPHGDAYYSRLQRIRAQAGIIRWPQDVLRHSFASYRYAACGDENLTRKDMGHYGSVHTFLRHYKNRVRDEDAKEFWAIIPDAP
jgi:integrase